MIMMMVMKKNNNCFIVSLRLIEIIFFNYTTGYCRISINATITINITIVSSVGLNNTCVCGNYQEFSYDS